MQTANDGEAALSSGGFAALSVGRDISAVSSVSTSAIAASPISAVSTVSGAGCIKLPSYLLHCTYYIFDINY